ncbi:MAG: fumarylacetoacetate hydrolase family protein [Rhodospirillaceae bacterium]|nr:fumarylacetoacetate hydrolase family protein [Rhodospirillaceae bacterium]MBT4589901.1 fumarylacetoacetate hydrolase family protein [Rhodospirillaceae bacterium]MBT5941684.1 fumarylacetoacetate hydrolase family protein [Rhodospirillaceae bacterium]MBT7267384.1 fumarylacetoacetate hydrolase family protein [Rhodospirillaceae bacterium]
MSDYKLLSYKDDGAVKAGIEVDGSIFNLASEVAFHAPDSGIDGSSLDTAIRRWADLEPILTKIANSPSTRAHALADADLAAPFSNPGTMYCAGANYYDHAEEMGNTIDKSAIEPLFFLKSNGAIIGPNDEIRLPKDYSQKYDWEVELAAVIGHEGHHLNLDNAMDIIAGYTIFNDVSARDVGRRTDWNFGMDWFRHKSFDTSAPMGPWVIPASQIADPQNLSLKTTVSGEVMQEGNTNGMVFSIAELIVSLTKQVPLRPGDIIATGTCAGVGFFRGVFFKPGDDVKLEVENIGELCNPIVQGQ